MNSPVKNASGCDNNESVKRKATSPVSLDKIEVIEIDNEIPVKTNHNTPKKQKTGNDILSPTKNAQKSPNKENCFDKTSPKTLNQHHIQASIKSCSRNHVSPAKKLTFSDPEEYKQNVCEIKTKVSQRALTPVTVISVNHEKIEKDILSKKNNEEGHQIQKQSYATKSVTPKKSPLKGK